MSDTAATTLGGRGEEMFLSTVPLFSGLPANELAELARILQRRELPAGQVIWREGDEAQGLLLIVDGRVSALLRLPGGGEIELATMGRGELLGELPLLDGGRHTATARVLDAATVLFLARADFAALVSRLHPTAFTIKRRIAAVACERLRRQFAGLAASLPGGEANSAGSNAEADVAGDPDELEAAPTPPAAYLCRLPVFRTFEPAALDEVVRAGRFALYPDRRTLVAEGAPSNACYVTINGAVEEVIVRGARRIRVGLAGPGRAFGYESLLDDRPAPVTAVTRERSLLLVLHKAAFARLFHGDTAGAHSFVDAISRDLTAALRQAHRPHARLAATPRPA